MEEQKLNLLLHSVDDMMFYRQQRRITNGGDCQKGLGCTLCGREMQPGAHPFFLLKKPDGWEDSQVKPRSFYYFIYAGTVHSKLKQHSSRTVVLHETQETTQTEYYIKCIGAFRVQYNTFESANSQPLHNSIMDKCYVCKNERRLAEEKMYSRWSIQHCDGSIEIEMA